MTDQECEVCERPADSCELCGKLATHDIGTQNPLCAECVERLYGLINGLSKCIDQLERKTARRVP